MLTISALVLATMSSWASGPGGCRATTEKSIKLALAPTAAEVACLGNNTATKAVECLTFLKDHRKGFAEMPFPAAVACAGGSSGANANACLNSFMKNETRAGFDALAGITCGSSTPAAKAKTCVTEIAHNDILKDAKYKESRDLIMVSGLEQSVGLEEGARYFIAANACKGSGDSVKVAECLSSVGQLIKTQTKASSDERVKRDYGNPAGVYTAAALACAGGSDAKDATACVEGLMNIEGMDFYFASQTCGYKNSASHAVECAKIIAANEKDEATHVAIGGFPIFLAKVGFLVAQNCATGMKFDLPKPTKQVHDAADPKTAPSNTKPSSDNVNPNNGVKTE